MADFVWPDWLPTAPELPPPPVDPHRIEGLANRFIAASQDALHTGPDALVGKSGADAIEAAPAVAEQLSGLRDATLDLARDEHERQALADRLERYHSVARDDIDRHVAGQRQAAARQTIADRQVLNLRAAGLRHNQDTLYGLAEAHAQAARVLAGLDGLPEEPAMQAARSAIWHGAIDQRLADGESARALSLFERAKDVLIPGDQRALEVPLQAARIDTAADTWIVREEAKSGDPLIVRVQADTDLSPAEKSATLAKIAARDSARESARIATVKGLDDKREAVADALATRPSSYKPGTLAALANAYEDAGEPAKAAPIRRLAEREGFLRAFAQSSTAGQQRLIDSLPEAEDRAAAEAIQARQNEAFTKDAFSAGIALYPDVGPLKPAEDISGRIVQARTIAAYRGIPVAPFSADEIATMRRRLADGTPQQQEAVLTLVDAVPDDMKPALNGPSPGGPRAYGIDVEASMKAARELRGQGDDENATGAGGRGAVHATEPPPDSDEYRDAEARRLAAQEQIATDRMISQWVSQARPGDEIPPALAERLDADQKRAVESLVSQAGDAKTDPTVFQEILTGLRSRNPEEARKWEQAPLYKERARLSAKDFAKLVELQQDLDPDHGYSLTELAAIRKGLKAADTSDLASLYKALEPDPSAEYGTLLPFAKDANGVRPAMPEQLRSFLKGVLDLLAGTKTGEMTPEAIDAFTTIAGGAGRAFGPRGGGETLAAGGKRKPLPPLSYAKGHHWVSGPIRRLSNLSAEARKVFNKAVSGPYGEPHRWSGPHAEYNHAVQELWHKNHYNPAKMTTKDAEDFIGQIKRSRDPRIAEFRDMIVDKRTEYLREPGAKPSGGKRR